MNVSRIYRLLRLITLLQSGRSYTAGQLAEELEVSRRTIFRDLNALEMARIPYYYDPEAKSYRINGHFFLPPMNLTLSEALAVMVHAGRMRPSARLPLMASSTTAALKVESSLPAALRRHVGSVADKLSMSMGPVSRHEGLDAVFDDLARSAGEHRVCTMVYLSFRDRKQLQLTVHPLRLVFLGRAWYVIAHVPRYGEARTFKLARVKTLTVTDETFEPPAGVDVDNHFGQAWSMIPEGKLFDVHIRFSPKMAGNVAEVCWHASQQVQWRDDGSMDFHVRVDGLGEILWWVLGYGWHAEVISPPALRRQVARAARFMLEKYPDIEARPGEDESEQEAGDEGHRPAGS